MCVRVLPIAVTTRMLQVIVDQQKHNQHNCAAVAFRMSHALLLASWY